MSEPASRTQAKVDGTFGATHHLETRPGKPPVDSVDIEHDPSSARAAAKAAGTFGETAAFLTRERRDLPPEAR